MEKKIKIEVLWHKATAKDIILQWYRDEAKEIKATKRITRQQPYIHLGVQQESCTKQDIKPQSHYYNLDVRKE